MVVMSEENIRPDFALVDEHDTSSMGEAKKWLFKENMRLMNLSKELDEREQTLEKEYAGLKEELKAEMKKLQVKESQLILQKKHVDDQLNILRRGFDELNADRQMFEAKRKNSSSQMYSVNNDSLFFRGVNSISALKKRYHELLKIYHPDNVAGDVETARILKEEYEELKETFE